jgi:hypothetical protein
MTQTTDDRQEAEPIYGPFPELPADDAMAIAAVEGNPAAGPTPGSEDAPLLDGDLEQGIASIFAALHSATDGTQPAAEAGDGDGDEVDVAEVDMSTFRLLGELDRLWHRAA